MPQISKDRRSRDSSLGKSTDEGTEGSTWKQLPQIKMSNVLRKIGAGDRNRQMQMPNEEEQTAHRKVRMAELSR